MSKLRFDSIEDYWAAQPKDDVRKARAEALGVENTSGLVPLGRAVLVEYYEPERKQGMIVIPESVQNRVNMVEQRARVIEVGPACWPDEPHRAQPGDYVLISAMAGYACKGPKDAKSYRLINDRDIFAGITHLEEAHV